MSFPAKPSEPVQRSAATRPLLTNLLLVVAPLTLLLLLFECVLRIIGFNPFGDLLNNEERSVFIRPSKNPLRIFEATPGARGTGWGTEVHINRHGFRGQDIAIKKPQNTYRIVVLGDSITFGNNLPPTQNYPAMLEQRLKAAGKRVDVLNLGLGGYDTLQEVATLEDIGLKFQPDVVVLGYCINDISVASGNLNYIKRLQKYGSPLYRSRFAQWVRVQLDRIDEEKYLARANDAATFRNTYRHTLANISDDKVLSELMSTLAATRAQSGARAIFTADYTDADHVRRLRFALEKLRALQEAHGFTVFVIIFPYLLETPATHNSYQQVYQLVQHETSRLGFTTVDIATPLTTAGLNNMILKPNDGIHPNADGHRLVAETLFARFDNLITTPEVPTR